MMVEGFFAAQIYWRLHLSRAKPITLVRQTSNLEDTGSNVGYYEIRTESQGNILERVSNSRNSMLTTMMVHSSHQARQLVQIQDCQQNH